MLVIFIIYAPSCGTGNSIRLLLKQWEWRTETSKRGAKREVVSRKLFMRNVIINFNAEKSGRPEFKTRMSVHAHIVLFKLYSP